MIQFDNAIDSSCSPPSADKPWQVSLQMKSHNDEKVGFIFFRRSYKHWLCIYIYIYIYK